MQRPAQEILDELYRSPQKTTAAGGVREIDFTLSVDRPAAKALYDTVLRVAPARSLEVGMAWGFSTVAIGLALRDRGQGRHTVIDPYQHVWFEGVGVKAVEQYGLSEHVDFREARSDAELPRILEGSPERSLDFAYIDGDHRVDAVFLDFYYINRLLRPGGIVIFDDLYFPSVKRVVAYAQANFHYRKLELGIERFAMLELLAPDDRPWDHYGDF